MTLAVRNVLLCLAASAALQAEPQVQPETTVEEELRRLQGSWQIETQEENGDKLAADDIKGRSILFGKDTFFIRHENKVVQIGMLKLNTSKNPRTVNAAIMMGDKKGDIMQGIYALDGDSLKICLDTEGQDRPKEFKTAPKSGLVLYVLKRIRVKGEDQELVGNYRSETTELDGKKHLLDVAIERVGDAYLVTYKKNNAIGFVGIGLRKGDVFCVSWLSQGQVGVSMYQIEKGHRLVGHFTILGGPGVLGQETLTRLMKDV